jgi:hypothetical protein
MSSDFPFEEVDPYEMIPGHKYYIGAKTKTKKNYTKKAEKGMVTKLSGIFEGQIVGDLGDKYAEFSNLRLEGAGKPFRYFKGTNIVNPYFNAGDIMVGKKLPNGTYKKYKRQTLKLPGHQALNTKTFSSKIWLLDIKKWKFGAGLRNAAHAHMAEQAMEEGLASRGIYLPRNIVNMSRFFTNTNKNTTFKNRKNKNGEHNKNGKK